ncbi:MAG: ATPase domain-containing protein [Bdellovibrionota bacterium]
MQHSHSNLVPTGCEGLDDILQGGLAAHRLYLIEGNPGSGKTTLALKFLIEGAARGESGLYVTLSETKEEIYSVAAGHGWSIENIPIFELVASEESLEPESQFTMYHPSEVELSETTKAVLTEVERIRPQIVVFDSLSEMRLLAQNPLRYRRQILALKQFFTGRHCTVLLLDDRTSEIGDLQLQSIAHGVISLEQLAPEVGAERRRLRVVKMRGRSYRGGYHDFVIQRGGLKVFPRLVAAEHRQDQVSSELSSGIGELDELLGGGIESGTSTLLIGPAGSGKSSIMAKYLSTATARGKTACLFTFEESVHSLLTRSRNLGMDLKPAIERGALIVHAIDPAEISPGQFSYLVRQAVEQHDVKIVAVDSLNGFLNSMPEERFLTIQLHEILTYLGHCGVSSLLVLAQHGVLGSGIQSPIDTSYLADAVVLLRFFEVGGEVRRAISVLKKRTGSHERTIRELILARGEIHLSEPLRGFRGILSGLPTPAASHLGSAE